MAHPRYAFIHQAAGGLDDQPKASRLNQEFSEWDPEVLRIVEATTEADIKRRDTFDRPPEIFK